MVLTSVLTVIACVIQLPQDPPAPIDFPTAWRKVADTLHAECDQAGVVGGSILFLRGNELLGFEAHGFADRARQRPVDRDTIFHWASCTKTFTGIAVMQLRDRGKLRLDQPIVDFVPELRAAHDPFGKVDDITVTHLLTHSAGFRAGTWPWGGDKDWHPHEPTQWSQLVAMMPYTAVEFAPGSKFAYSNPGIVFLGRAIEQLSGDDYEVYMEKNVLRPLGLGRTYFDVTPYHLQRFRSHSYEVKGKETNDLGPDFDTGITVSNGGLNAPVTDLARYLSFLLGAMPAGSDAANVLARSSLEAMWEPRLPTAPSKDGAPSVDHIGLTFFVQERGGTRVVSHTGGQRSFVTFFYVHPASGTGACGAFNTSTAGPVMGKLRSLCLETLSLPMVRR
ncbi:MAG: beta-lactamase family protein [Planctomycetes bacterium]|nr:beta-lactamase family protein [Planctomycetota bacterium]